MNSKKKPLDFSIYWRRLLPCSLLGILVWAVPDAEANWRVSPEVRVSIAYDDNTRLNDVSGSSNSDTGYAIQARATFIYDSELTDFSFIPMLQSRWYRDDDRLDSNDQFLRFGFAHRRQKSYFRLRGRFSSESVRTAERSQVDFEIEDPEEISDDDTARVFDTGKRDRWRLDPEITFNLTQRTSLRILGNYQDTSYDDDVSLLLSGFTNYSIGLSLGYNWSERDTISLNASTGNYEVERSDFDSTSNEFGIGYSRKLSERTRFRMRVSSDTSEDGNGEDQTNLAGEISVIHRYLTTSVIASYRRTTSGDGSSERVLRDAFNLYASRNIGPKLTLNGGVSLYTTQALDNSDTSFNEYDYLQFRATARWTVSRVVSLDLDYRYTDVDRKIMGTGDVGGESNQIGLWLNWHPNPLPR